MVKTKMYEALHSIEFSVDRYQYFFVTKILIKQLPFHRDSWKASSTLYLFILFYLLLKKTTFPQSDSNYIVSQMKVWEMFESQFISFQHEQQVINQRTHGGNVSWRRGTDAQLQICANPVSVFVVLDA